ncbi:hypothetical protein ACFQX4_26570 [Roseomonas sp. GCM10028921]
MHDSAEEELILDRLARAHKEWRDGRPPPPPRETGEEKARILDLLQQVQNPEPQDVEVLRAAPADPLEAAIWSQLSVVGWRLYARGGVGLLATVYRRLEAEQHPGFVYEVQRAWRDLGFPGDPRGVWSGLELL